MRDHRRTGTGIFFGLLLVAAGILWVLHNTRIIDFHIRNWWPLILIWLGLHHLYRRRRIFEFSSWMLIGPGVIFLLSANGIIDGREIWKYWPLILVILGLSIVFSGGGWKPESGFKINLNRNSEESGDEPGVSSDGQIVESIVFGGVSKRITAKSFKGGSISVVFGGAEIDLRAAQLAEEGAVLDVSTVFGGVEIRIPGTWVVQTRPSALLGGVGRKYSNTEGETGKRLRVNASALFGGVEIKN